MVLQLNKWFKDLDRMKMHGQERNLYVDSKTLKNSLMPVTQRGLEKCRGLLQQVARDRCVHSLQEHQHKMRDLGEQPRSLRDFASYCDNVNRVRDETKEMEERAQQVNEMYDLLDVYEVKIAAQDAVKKDDLKEARVFAAKMADADVAVEQRMPQARPQPSPAPCLPSIFSRSPRPSPSSPRRRCPLERSISN